MHPLLERQLRRLGLDPGMAPPVAATWEEFCDRVSETYATADQDRYLLERSMNLASTEMRELYENLRDAAEPRYANLFENASDAIFTMDLAGQLTSVNRALEELTGLDRNELVGRHWRDVLHVSDDAATRAMMLDPRGDGVATVRFDADVVSLSERRSTLEVRTHLILRDGQLQEVVAVGRDLSERRWHEAHLKYLAEHDSLTRLPNRRVLEQALEEAMADIRTDGEIFVLGLFDLDDFKLINDTLGHAAGDHVLVSIANILRLSLPGATVARLSGDEFAFIYRRRSEADAIHAAEEMRKRIEQTEVSVVDERVFVSASIALVRVEPSSNPGALLAEADAAMYRAKDEGRNRVHWSGSKDGLTGQLTGVYRWAAALRTAMEEGRLEVHYQPVFALAGAGEIAHYEALLRLRSPEGEIATAGLFLPATERSGLMPAIDRFVVDAVLQKLRDAPWARIYLNLSAATLANQQALGALMRTLHQQPDLGPRLGIEITETTALRDTALVRHWIEELRSIGCEFTLDDFGTGFNSLTYLKELPVNQTKIDGSFVLSIGEDHRQRAVVAAVQALADGLGIATVAECIETAEALEIIKALGVTYGQGFLLGRPAQEQTGHLRAAA